MAAKDYSHRPKKDVFIDNDNQDAPKSGQSQHNASSDIDIDGIIEKHRTDINVLKVSIIIITIVIVVLGVMFGISCSPKIVGKIIAGIIFGVTALAISLMCTDFLYKMFIKILVKSIDAIKCYKLRRRKPKVLKRLLTFDVPIYSSRNENVTMIEIGDTTVTASHFSYSRNKGNRNISTIYQGECYAATIKNKLKPNGIWLLGGSPYYIKKGKHLCKSKGYTIYADTAEAIQNCNINDIGVFAKTIKKAIDCYSFVLYFENGIMYLIEQKDNEGFDTDVFDFNIEKYLRRDLAIINHRIKIAEVLASA